MVYFMKDAFRAFCRLGPKRLLGLNETHNE